MLELFPFMRRALNSAVDLLSGGEQQMIAIGRALLLKPDLLILDEPSTGLAPKVVKDIVSVVAGLRRRGMSLILVEQNVADCRTEFGSSLRHVARAGGQARRPGRLVRIRPLGIW